MHEELCYISGDHILLANFGAVIALYLIVAGSSLWSMATTPRPMRLPHRPF